MGGAWTNGFQSVGKRRPMGQGMGWPKGFQPLGKRNMDDFWDEGDDEMMDFMKKKSGLPQIYTERLGKRSDLPQIYTQRLGKRSDLGRFADLGFLNQRMGKRLMQRFGRMPRSNTNVFRIIKRNTVDKPIALNAMFKQQMHPEYPPMLWV